MTNLKSLVITAPILPGKLELWRRCVAALLGEHLEIYRGAIRDGGLTRLRVWHQYAPDGSDLAVVLYEGPAPERFLQRIATGADEFSGWFRRMLVEMHGLDLGQPPPPAPELVIDENVAAAIHSCARVTVRDPAAWRRVMDELRALRVEHGQVSEQILQNPDDEHDVTVVIGWQGESRARQYYGHPELGRGIERAGGIEGRGGVQFLAQR